ncbi:transcriptional repressor NrdR [Candidatus Saccharibacteria bacterium]|jgi:transcriptional repressor NrdR|nr:transcriptional repressor NrdR [Candidatus Saccharibacteria bacterium]
MQCPNCSHDNSKVIESRDLDAGAAIRRRRQCLDCSYRYTTYERIERPQLIVIKKDGVRQRFNRSKLLHGLSIASEKRPVTSLQLEELVGKVERELYASGEGEINSRSIGEASMKLLRDLDEVAYVRFASVYRSFKDIDSFQEELQKLRSVSPEN